MRNSQGHLGQARGRTALSLQARCVPPDVCSVVLLQQISVSFGSMIAVFVADGFESTYLDQQNITVGPTLTDEVAFRTWLIDDSQNAYVSGMQEE